MRAGAIVLGEPLRCPLSGAKGKGPALFNLCLRLDLSGRTARLTEHAQSSSLPNDPRAFQRSPTKQLGAAGITPRDDVDHRDPPWCFDDH